MTPTQWAQAVLAKLAPDGVSQSPANVKALVAWAQAEGGNWHNSAAFNPVNTTLDAPGATSINSVGVKRYTSWTQGIDATVSTIKQGNMAPILDALKGGGGCGSLASALSKAPWGTNGATVAKLCGVPYDPKTAVAAATTASGSTTSSKSGGIDLNPLDWPGIIAGDIFGAIMGPVSRVFWGVAGIAIMSLGMLLMILSVFAPSGHKSAQPQPGAAAPQPQPQSKAEEAAKTGEEAGEDAAKVAAVAAV